MAAKDPYQLHFRLPEETSKQVDRYARYVKEATGADLSRTDAVLALVNKALDEWVDTQPAKSNNEKFSEIGRAMRDAKKKIGGHQLVTKRG